MPFAACRASSVVFRAIATDSLAAASQLLADVQRFGLQMVEFRMMVDGEGGAAIDFGRPTLTGAITFGNSTRFRSGISATTPGGNSMGDGGAG